VITKVTTDSCPNTFDAVDILTSYVPLSFSSYTVLR
jgi:hypothetical protein